MSHFLNVDLPRDLPEAWSTDDYVAPEGPDVGLSEQHGYNYLCRQVNNAQKAAMSLATVACAGSENLVDNSFFEDPINSAGGYCVMKGTQYYRDTALTQLSNTTTESLAAEYVNTTYGTITVGTTKYYVSYADMYEGYSTSARVFTFDRWYGLTCCAVRNKTGKGITISPVSIYTPGQFFQPIAYPARLANKRVTLSVLVEEVTGEVTANLYTSTYADASITRDVTSMRLKVGMNTRVITLPSDLGESTAPYLHLSILTLKGTSVTIRAVKLQFGEEQTLAYNDGDNWQYVQLPNRIVEYLRCVGAPVEYGGTGSLLTSPVVSATVEEEE